MTSQPENNQLPVKTPDALNSLENQLLNFNLDLLYALNIYVLRPLYKCRKIMIEILGWYGVSAVIGSYFLVSFLIIAPSSAAYQILNASGALCLAGASLNKRAYQPTVSNTTWAAIAVIALIQILTGHLH